MGREGKGNGEKKMSRDSGDNEVIQENKRGIRLIEKRNQIAQSTLMVKKGSTFTQ